MSRPPCLLLSFQFFRDLGVVSRHHVCCFINSWSSDLEFLLLPWCYSSLLSRSRHQVLSFKIICDFFYLRRLFLWLCRQLLVATSWWHQDIIYLLLVSRHRNDVARHKLLHLTASFNLDQVIFFCLSFLLQVTTSLVHSSVSSSKPNLLMS